MALITIGTTLVDVADVALVAPRGSASQVYLADGSELASASSAATQATAVNAAGAGVQLTTVVVSSNFGSCYISGPNTQRVDTDAAGTGTIWFLRGGPGPVVCAATNLAAAGVLLNATAADTGGGYEIEWTPVPASAQATGLTVGSATATRIGNTVNITYRVSGTSTPTGAVTITTPVPVAALALTTGVAQGDAGAGLSASFASSVTAGNHTFLFTGAAATAFACWTTVTYEVA